MTVAFGIFRAICADNNDQQSLGRIRVTCPALWGNSISGWAWPCVPVRGSQVPAVGQITWITFEGGDENHPVWLGVTFAPTPGLSALIAAAPQTPDSGATIVLPVGYLPPSGSDKASNAVVYCLEQLGKPYVWQAAGPNGFDCSGLVMAAYASTGIAIPRTTYAQYKTGTAVPNSLWTYNGLLPGDLVFQNGSDPGYGGAPGHVGMYIGYGTTGVSPNFVYTGYIINACCTGSPVEIDTLASWVSLITYVRRIAA